MGFLEWEFLMVLAVYEDNTKQGNLTMRTRPVSQNLSFFQHLPKNPKSKLESSWKICGRGAEYNLEDRAICGVLRGDHSMPFFHS